MYVKQSVSFFFTFNKQALVSTIDTYALDINVRNVYKTSYSKLLEYFWKNHNSCSGSSKQYISSIYYHDENQKELAEKTFNEQHKKIGKKVIFLQKKLSTLQNKIKSMKECYIE